MVRHSWFWSFRQTSGLSTSIHHRYYRYTTHINFLFASYNIYSYIYIVIYIYIKYSSATFLGMCLYNDVCNHAKIN